MNQTNIIEDLTLMPLPAWWQNPWLIGALLVAALVLGYLAYRFWPQSKPAAAVPPQPKGPPPDTTALERLQALRQRVVSLGHYALSIEVSDILRDYLGERFPSPAKFQTTREYLASMARDAAGHSGLPEEKLRGFLNTCDLLKFAQGIATLGEQGKLIDTAEEIVRTTAQARNS